MISALITTLLPVLGEVVSRLVPDAAGQQKALQEIEAALIKAETEGRLAQIEVNKVEAGHRSIFVAGWRPFTGWCCAAALAYHFIVAPVAVFVMATAGVEQTLPAFDMDALLTVLLGMLGLGGMRSFEKFKGVAK